MPEFIETPAEVVVLNESLTMEVTNNQAMYGSVALADRYFSEQIYGELWEITTLGMKQKALMTATRNLDCLRFAGRKNDESQAREFPRNDETDVPLEIQQATYEEALALLKGVETDTEFAGTFVSSRVFGKVRTDYDYRTSPQHITAGIASDRAFRLLMPFLDPAKGVRLRRAS